MLQTLHLELFFLNTETMVDYTLLVSIQEIFLAAEINYEIYDKELLAIIDAFEE